MRIINQYCEWEQRPPQDALQLIEHAGRTCYKSTSESCDTTIPFVQKILQRGHESVIEHVSASMRFITDRGVTHEIVRHRLASYSQESTRYCNYSNQRFGKELTIIQPVWLSDVDEPLSPASVWKAAMLASERHYTTLLEMGWSPQQARAVLTNSLKTEIVMTANLREWRHFFKLRTSASAHPQMRDLALKALGMFKEAVSVIFDDLPQEPSK